MVCGISLEEMVYLGTVSVKVTESRNSTACTTNFPNHVSQMSHIFTDVSSVLCPTTISVNTGAELLLILARRIEPIPRDQDMACVHKSNMTDHALKDHSTRTIKGQLTMANGRCMQSNE